MRPACPRSGCTTSATAIRPPPWPLASQPTWSASASATIAITMDTNSHVLPGLDKQAAGTVARLILGDADQEPARPVDKALTTDHPTPRRRKEVKREAPGQEVVRAWGFEPHGLPHRDLNCTRGVLAGAVLASTRPPSWADAAAPSRPVLAHPGVLRRVP
jgi:hypothetical protein